MTAVASLDAFGRVTLGVHGKPLKPPEIVAVINGLRNQLAEAKGRVDVLMKENTALRKDLRQQCETLDEAPALTSTETEEVPVVHVAKGEEIRVDGAHSHDGGAPPSPASHPERGHTR